MYTWETFQAAYQSASPEVKALIDSETIPNCVSTCIAKNNLDHSHQTTLVRLLSLLVVNATTPQTVEQAMLQLAIPQSKLRLQELLTCAGVSSQSSVVPEKQATGANPLKPIPQIRTMADDMSRSQQEGEVVYSTTQEAILKGGWSTPKSDQSK